MSGANGTIYRAMRDRRSLGTRPVDSAERLTDQRTESCEHSRWKVGHRAAAGPLLLPPGCLDDLRRSRGATPESSGQSIENGPTTLRLVEGIDALGHPSKGERGDHSRSAGRGSGIERHFRCGVGLRGLTAESVTAPERLVVPRGGSSTPGRQRSFGTTSADPAGARDRKPSPERARAALPRSHAPQTP